MGWKTAKICITIADRNNYARNARERDGGIRTRMQMQTVRWWWNRRVCGGEGKAASTTETRLEMQIREYAGGSSRQRKKKKKNEAGYGVKREEKVETRKGGEWKKRSGSGGGERKVLCLCSVYTGQAKEKAGKNGIRNVQPEVETVSAPWTPPFHATAG